MCEIIRFFQLYLTTRLLCFIIVYRLICEEFSVKVITTFINIIDVNEMLIEIDEADRVAVIFVPTNSGQFRTLPDNCGHWAFQITYLCTVITKG